MAFNMYGGPGEEDDAPGQAAFGNPGADTGGAEVTPQAMASGGAIPDDDDDDELTGDASPNTDVVDYSNVMKVVKQALNWGRQQHGLPASRPQEANDAEDQGVPDDEGGDESYAEGGAIYDEPEMASAVDYDDERAAAERGAIDDGDVNGVGMQGDMGGGTIDNSDNSGVAPVVEGGFAPDPQSGDNSGALPVAGDQTATPLQYLQGADAMPEPQAKALEAAVSSDAEHDPNARTMQAVQRAAETKGPAAAFSYLQRNRKIYDASMSHARAALSGVEGRPPSLDSAVESATKAYVHMPEASDVRFMAENGGVRATVRDLNTDKRQQYNLTPQQFAQVTDITKDGQFDRVLAAGGMGPLLQKLVGAGQAGAQPGMQQRQQDERDAPAGYPMQPQGLMERTGPMRSGRVPESGSYDDNGGFRSKTPAHNGSFRQDRPDNVGASIAIHAGGDSRNYINGVDQTQNENQERVLERIRAKNEGRPTQADRLELEDRRTQGRMGVEGEKNKRAEASQAIRGKYNEGRLANELKRIAATQQNATAHDRRAMINTAIQAAGGIDRVPKEIRKLADEVLNGGGGQQQAAPQQQPTGGRQMSPQDQQALLWANANPNNPKAAKIKQLLGQ